MKKIFDISIKWKVMAIALCGPVIIALLFASQRISDIRKGAIDRMVEKSAAIVVMAESGRHAMADRLELGLIKPFSEIPADKIIHAVPVVAAMDMAAENAKEMGYEFRAPKVSPRNPKNTPTPEELGYLKRFKSEKLKELIVVKDDEVRYLRPVKLTPDCLFCHGDPKGEKDPTGGTKEGWRAGEIHGAFQITSSLARVNAQISQTKFAIIGWTVAILAAITLVVWFLMQTSIIGPIQKISRHIKKIAGGNLTSKMDISSSDEVGAMAQDIDYMSDQLREMIHSITESSDLLHQASSQVGKSSGDISRGTANLNERSSTVAASAEEMSVNMTSVAAATEEASTNIGLVAASTEDMAVTIREIAKNTEKTQAVTSRAVSRAESASNLVDQLGDAATKIGAVTETISEISAQTNLLALNATIEAARAGEAGKGFAVVANEIKDLAHQTSQATQEIKSRIEGIQNRTDSTVSEIQEITKVIAEVNEIVTQVATAVEEQNATTTEIAENISQATQGIQEVTENVSQGSIAAEEVASNINQVSAESVEIDKQTGELERKAAELKSLSEKLQATIGSFTV